MKRKGFALRLQDNCWWIAAVIFGTNLVWQLLELLLYGEVQPRRVDDMIGLVWIWSLYAAYNRGYGHAYMDGWWDANRWRDRT